MKRVLCISLVSILIATGFTSISYAAIKMNSSCEKEGQKVTEKSKTFICKKVGKKLLWTQQTLLPKKSVDVPTTKVSTINYWSSPSQYELLNLDSDPNRVMILIKKLDLRKQQLIWGSEARIFIYLVAGGEEFLHVNTLQQLIDAGSQESVLLSLWKKTAMDGAVLKIAIGNLFQDKTIQLDTLIDATDLSSKMIPEKNWILESQVDLKKIVRTVKTLPSAAPTPSATPAPSPKSTPVKTTNPTSRLPSCTGTQEANLVNLLAQAVATKRLVSTYRGYLEKTINDLGDAYARNAMYDYEKLLIDKKSWESKLEEQYKKLDNLTALEASILSTCTRGSENSGSSTAPNQKKLPCTETEVSRLLIMISQYSSKQELIRISRANIEKLQIDLSYAISSGRNTGSLQLAIQKYSRLLETDLGSANLIKREFEALNSGCLNSRLSLP